VRGVKGTCGTGANWRYNCAAKEKSVYKAVLAFFSRTTEVDPVCGYVSIVGTKTKKRLWYVKTAVLREETTLVILVITGIPRTSFSMMKESKI
jgi:hypothetical protein